MSDDRKSMADQATLEKLQHDLEAERRASAELRESVQRLQEAVSEMQSEFATQLDQARSKATSAESRLVDQSARLSALGHGREETMRDLQLTRQELSVVKSERDQLLKRLTAVEGMQTETVALSDDNGNEPEIGEAPSIDELMASLSDMMEDTSHGRRGFTETQADTGQNEWQEMLPAELIAPEAFDESDQNEAPIQRGASRLLIFLDGDKPVKYPLFKDVITIGRSETADIQIDGDFISRIHARVMCHEPEALVEDAGSKNGIKINGETVDRHYLKHGDVLGIGRARFTFVDASSAE